MIALSAGKAGAARTEFWQGCFLFRMQAPPRDLPVRMEKVCLPDRS